MNNSNTTTTTTTTASKSFFFYCWIILLHLTSTSAFVVNTFPPPPPPPPLHTSKTRRQISALHSATNNNNSNNNNINTQPRDNILILPSNLLFKNGLQRQISSSIKLARELWSDVDEYLDLLGDVSPGQRIKWRRQVVYAMCLMRVSCWSSCWVSIHMMVIIIIIYCFSLVIIHTLVLNY